ncbi:MAG: autotransporter-associated beta strand repeat-containing protein [Opitutus sp.]|nr:autotransporter-associated beta strand repeat-containing protein [Opitutus sp.]MCS6246952.1 autotransporter-associated beta strand repeat-containing protein [Opitutus sp.]MCS6272790.1 autotransporter-associated beta strand repeat-containing protein [Opitutus sp.]MCS6276422.1 autotransporter-associated beta strand repeat-containing protein [Opitutus sp.]MCS6301930.1 autotransporter-associated beta strand repeat-containing protein [Opitutus sp.]
MTSFYRFFLFCNELTTTWVALACFAFIGAVLPAPTWAQVAANQLPTGGSVVAGSASLTQDAAVLNINQSTARAAIDWATFNVGSAAQVNFNQPSSSSVTLNRVLDSNPSQIFGRITAPGQVFLTNPNGVVFAPGASVDVGGLVATTHRIGVDDFMAGGTTFERNGATGSVSNAGELRAALGGYIALLAPDVRNDGVIIAQSGTVALASGEAISLNFAGNGTLAGLTATPSQIAALVENNNAVLAPGGLIILSAQAVSSLQGGVIRHSGTLSASSLTEKGGRIWLEGDDISLTSSSQITATGATGGGEVLVGGDWMGGGTLKHAKVVTMEAGASIDASAITNGDGGKVVLWSDDYTGFHGTIAATSGISSGDGGQVETSSYNILQAFGTVDTSASAGQAGNWLLDPRNVTIAASGASGTAYSSTFTPTATSTILASSIVTSLNAGTSVTITTGSTGTDAGDITVASAIATGTAAGTRTLTLTAAGAIAVNANISNSTGTLNLVLNAGGTIDGTGAISGTGTTTFNPGTSGGEYSGNISKTNVIKEGSGRLMLSGNNTYTGTTTINDGRIRLGSTTALGTTASGTTIATGAALDLNGVTLSTAEALTLNGNWLDNGTEVGALHNDSSTTATYSGPITLGSDSSIASLTGNITLSGTIATAGFDLSVRGSENGTVSGIISGSGSLIKLGAGTWTLGAANTYTGATTISNGTLALNSTGTIESSSGVDVGSGDTFSIAGNKTIDSLTGSGTTDLGSNTLTIGDASNRSATYSGIISGTGGDITKAGTGTLTLSGANTFTGGTALNAGTLNLGSSGAIGSSGTISFGGGILQYSSANTTDYSSRFSTASSQLYNVDTNGQSVTWASALTSSGGTLTKAGTGTLTLGGVNTYTGATTISAGTLALNSTGTIASSSGITNNSAFSIGGNKTIDSMTGSGTTALGSNTLTIGDATNTSATYSGIISGTGGLTKAGTGTLTLSGVNTFTGLTTISEGILAATHSSALGTSAGGVTIAAGAALQLSGGITLADAISIVGGTSIRNLSGNNTLTGLITLTNDTIIQSDAGMLTLNPTSGSAITGVVFLRFNGAGDITVSDPLTIGKLFMLGTGTLTLSGANTYTGGTELSAGTLNLGSSGALGSSGTITFGGGTLQYSSANITDYSSRFSTDASQQYKVDTNGQSVTWASALTSSGGTLTKAGTGTLTLGGVNTYTGATTISAGTLGLNSTGTIASSSGVANSGNFTIAGNKIIDSMTGSGTTELGSNTLTIGDATNTSATYSGIISGTGGLTKAGTGTLTLSGGNTFTGATTISAGTLALNSTGTIATSSGVANSGNFTIAGNKIIDSMTGSGTTALSSFTLTIGDADNRDATYSGIISGGGGLTKAGTGTLTLSGANTFTGATTISTGTLKLGSTAALGTIDGSTTVASGAALDLNGFTLSTAEALTLNGTGVSSGGALTNSSATAATYSGLITLGSTSSIVASSGNIVLSNTGTITGSGFGLTLDGTATGSSLASIIGTGAGTLTKAGSGTWTLSGANTFTGLTTISVGTLKLGSTAALGTTAGGTSVTSGAALDLNGFTLSTAEALTLNGTGVSSGGALTNSSATSATYSGLITLGSTSSIVASSGNIVLSNTGTITGSGFGLTLDGTATGSSLASIIGTGAGTLTKAGSGTWTLSGINTFTGATTISVGTLALNSTGTIATSSGVANSGNFTIAGSKTIDSMTGSGTTDLGASNTLTIGDASNTSATYSGIISGTGGLTKAGTGTLTLGGVNTFTGSTTISAGTLALDSTGTIADSSGVTNNGSFTIGANKVIQVLNGSGSINLNSHTLTLGSSGTNSIFSGVISGTGGIAKVGFTGLTLSGANTYSGATTISQGDLYLNTNNSLSDSTAVSVSSGSFFVLLNNFSDTVGSIEGAGTINLGTGTLTVGSNNTSTTFSGIIQETGSLVKSGTGTLTLGGVNLFTGATTISAGTLALDSTGTIATSSGVANSGNFSIAGNKTIDSMTGSGTTALGSNTLTIGDSSNTTATYNGIISGTGGITKVGAGSLILTGNNTFSGTTTITAGSLSVGNAGTSGTLGSGLVTNNASLIYSRSDSVSLSALSGNVSGTGNLTATIQGALLVDRTITLSGASSSILLTAGYNTAAGTATGGDVTITSPVTTTSGGKITVFSGNADTANLSAQMSGATGATKFKTYNASNASLSGAVAGTRNFYYRVNPSLSISGLTASKTYDGTTSATSSLSGGTLSGALDGDSYTLADLSLSSATYSTKDVGSRTLDAAYSFTAGTNGGFFVSGYGVNAFSGAGAGTIAAKALSLTASNATKTYGDTQSFAGTEFTSSGLVTGETIGSVTLTNSGGGATANVNSYAITPSAATGGTFTDSNYAISYVNGSQTVNPRVINLTGSRQYDGTTTLANGIFTLGNLANSETLALTGSGSMADKHIGTGKTVTLGTLALGNGTGAASNYTFTGGTHVTDITVAPITLTTSAVTKTYDGTTSAVGALAVSSGTLFGSDAISGGSFAFNTATAGVGNKTVTVSGATLNDNNGGSNYTISYAANTTSTINKATLTARADNDARFFSQTDTAGYKDVSYAGFVAGEGSGVLGGTLAIARSGLTGDGSADAAGSYALTPSGLTSANYDISFQTGTYTIVPAVSVVGDGRRRCDDLRSRQSEL